MALNTCDIELVDEGEVLFDDGSLPLGTGEFELVDEAPRPRRARPRPAATIPVEDVSRPPQGGSQRQLLAVLIVGGFLVGSGGVYLTTRGTAVEVPAAAVVVAAAAPAPVIKVTPVAPTATVTVTPIVEITEDEPAMIAEGAKPHRVRHARPAKRATRLAAAAPAATTATAAPAAPRKVSDWIDPFTQ